jgi:hypothetical protein
VAGDRLTIGPLSVTLLAVGLALIVTSAVRKRCAAG